MTTSAAQATHRAHPCRGRTEGLEIGGLVRQASGHARHRPPPEAPMRSTMQEFPLTIGARPAPRHRGARRRPRSSPPPPTGTRSRPTPTLGRRAARLANALRSLGIAGDQRVGTFQWNNAEHLEAYLAVPSMGAVLHTLNIRLFPEQLAYIANHAEDKVVIVDDSLVGPAGQAAARRSRPSSTCWWPAPRPPAPTSTRCAPAASRCYLYDDLLAAQPTTPSTGPRSTSATPRPCATPPAPPATPRAWSTATARPTCTRWPSAWASSAASPGPTGCCRSCRCSTPTPGAWPTPR